jgi:hypothetical protein
MAHETLPWERQKGESSEQFHAFTLYRDLGVRRRIEEVCYQLDLPDRTVRRWSQNRDWVRRAMLWDDEQDRVRRGIYQHVVKEMGERHARIALLMMEKVIMRLKTMDPRELSPQEVGKWIQIAVTIERQAFGEPGAIVQQTGQPQVQSILNDVKIIQSDPDALSSAVERWESLVVGARHSALESGESGSHNKSG